MRLFRPVNTLKCSEYPKTKDIVMMEIAWEPPTLYGHGGHSQAQCINQTDELQTMLPGTLVQEAIHRCCALWSEKLGTTASRNTDVI